MRNTNAGSLHPTRLLRHARSTQHLTMLAGPQTCSMLHMRALQQRLQIICHPTQAVVRVFQLAGLGVGVAKLDHSPSEEGGRGGQREAVGSRETTGSRGQDRDSCREKHVSSKRHMATHNRLLQVL